MKEQKKDETGLAGMPTRRLLSRRRALAARLGGAEQVLSGSLTEQTRRCGKPAAGAPAASRTARMPIVPGPRPAAGLRYVRVPGRGGAPVPARGEEVEQVLAEISAINAELLARRELA